jgi:hypothetical protein
MSDYIDTRDLVDELRVLVGGDEDTWDPEVVRELDEIDLARAEEIRDVLEEIGPEAAYGVTMIPKDDFEDYAREFASDMGAIQDLNSWPATCIDWEQAASELAMDYTSVEFDGTTYLYR